MPVKETVFSRDFMRASAPSKEEQYAYLSTIGAMSRQFNIFADGLVLALENLSSQELDVLQFSMTDITLDIENWGKHILKERIAIDIHTRFSLVSCEVSAHILEYEERDDFIRVGVQSDQTGLHKFDYTNQAFDTLDIYQRFMRDSSFQRVKDICTRIGGLHAHVLVNASKPWEGTISDDPTIIVKAVDGRPLNEKLDRYKEFGPTH